MPSYGMLGQEEAVTAAEITPPALHVLHARGRRAWPDVDLDVGVFSTLAAQRLGDGPFDGVHAGDLYLAIACAAELEPAIAALDRSYLSGLVRALVRRGYDLATAADAVQTVRVRFLVGERDHAPRITEYDGRGSLAIWIRVAVVRTAISLHRKYRRETVIDEVDVAAATHSPELDLLRRQFRPELEAALRTTFAALTHRERNLLRHQVIDRLGIDRIAAIYGVHRATSARWVARARQALLEGVRRTLQDRLRIPGAELDSLLRPLASQLDISLQRLFLTPRLA
jgi:RNA polymerase sigma-70 factor (ECF subfamily)